MNALIPALLLALSLPAHAAPKKQAPRPIPEKQAREALAKYSALAFQEISTATEAAQKLNVALRTLTEKPSPETHLAAKNAWLAARDAYSPTEAYRFYGGPIDDPKSGPEGLLNAWPIDEAYLDAVKGDVNAGLIQKSKEYPKLTRELLVEMNEKNGEKNISTGYHAIEFLLWGQDFSASGPGERTFADYDPKQSPTAARRATVLKHLGDLLVEHLRQVRSAWDPKNSSHYGKALAAEPLDESLRKVFTGMITLSIDEMSGERMLVPLEKNDQENEQDCFSDYTLADLASNQRGIERIYFDGGIRDLISALDPKLAVRIDTRLKASALALKAVPHPFDQVIASKKSSSARKKAQAAIDALQKQGVELGKAGESMGLILNAQAGEG